MSHPLAPPRAPTPTPAPLTHTLSTTIRTLPRFASDAAGLEKTLRLWQAVSQLAIAYAASPSPSAGAVPSWALMARKQLALGRRYLRFFKFLDAYAKAYAAVVSGGGSGLAVMGFMKWSCLGTYLLLESCTLLHAMDILHSPLGATLLLHAHQFWFYALISSLLLSLLQLLQLQFAASSVPLSRPPREEEMEEEDKEDKEKKQTRTSTATEAEQWRRDERRMRQQHHQQRQRRRRRQRALMKSIVVDAADLLLPGAVTGWLRTGPAVVGWATVVSTVVGSEEIWERVRREGGW